MIRLLFLALAIILILVYFYRKRASEGFGVCEACDQAPAPPLGAINPMIWPCSGTPAINNKYVWYVSEPNPKPVNTTDAAEALLPNNESGMNVLTLPDQEYLTN